MIKFFIWKVRSIFAVFFYLKKQIENRPHFDIEKEKNKMETMKKKDKGEK